MRTPSGLVQKRICCFALGMGVGGGNRDKLYPHRARAYEVEGVRTANPALILPGTSVPAHSSPGGRQLAPTGTGVSLRAVPVSRQWEPLEPHEGGEIPTGKETP